jgi:hypothetical protein
MGDCLVGWVAQPRGWDVAGTVQNTTQIYLHSRSMRTGVGQMNSRAQKAYLTGVHAPSVTRAQVGVVATATTVNLSEVSSPFIGFGTDIIELGSVRHGGTVGTQNLGENPGARPGAARTCC